ncbi:hypothetical protein NL676_008886 [Syzygium grande]|nr:hypothetical protein NL676_008886 [Syzygium grande]
MRSNFSLLVLAEIEPPAHGLVLSRLSCDDWRPPVSAVEVVRRFPTAADCFVWCLAEKGTLGRRCRSRPGRGGQARSRAAGWKADRPKAKIWAWAMASPRLPGYEGVDSGWPGTSSKMVSNFGELEGFVLENKRIGATSPQFRMSLVPFAIDRWGLPPVFVPKEPSKEIE